MFISQICPERIFSLNKKDYNENSDFVLYWMIANRRSHDNFSLDYALELANFYGKKLIVLEALAIDYPWASLRFHQFIIEGMLDNQKELQEKNICYYPFVEQTKDQGKNLLSSFAQAAFAVVTDYYPCFFLPAIVNKIAKTSPVPVISVDSNGIFPLQKTPRSFTTAASFRRYLQKNILSSLSQFPNPDIAPQKEQATVPTAITIKWPATDIQALRNNKLKTLNIDHNISAINLRGGSVAAHKKYQYFLTHNFDQYAENRNSVDSDPSSGLSPYLHFGHISSHTIFRALCKKENWTIPTIAPKATGSREGWWRMSASAEAFLDQIITWRELGFVFCHHNPDYDQYDSLSEWARKTMSDHKDDPRPYTYSLNQFEQSLTHDPIWNACQNQLRTQGIIHNYLRMYWGKKILHWSSSPQEALNIMIELNNKYAIDGRDPNSYSGIFWTLGRFDRAWGPERPIFGKIRYMSGDSTKRKLRLNNYLSQYSAATATLPLNF